MNKPPTGERILSLLVELLADQWGVNVKYKIEKGEANEEQSKESA